MKPDSAPTRTAKQGHDPVAMLRRKFRLLGGLAVALLGGLVWFITQNLVRNHYRDKTTIATDVVNNEYFKRLIASGTAAESSLRQIAEAKPYGEGFIGLSREPLSWTGAQALAASVGGEVLDPKRTALVRKGELGRWIADSLPSTAGQAVWVAEDDRAALADAPDFLGVAGIGAPHRVLVRWPRSGDWKNHGWNWVIPPIYDQALPFSERQLGAVRKGGKWGLVDPVGTVVQAPTFDEVAEPAEAAGSVKVRRGETWGLLDAGGRMLVEPEWEDIQPLINGFIPVKRNGLWGYLDASGKPAVPCRWQEAWRFSPEGFAVVTRDGLRGFIDRTGTVLVQPEWDGAVNFAKEGVAAVRRGEGWAFIDTTGQLLCEPMWSLEWRQRRLDLGLVPVSVSVPSRSGRVAGTAELQRVRGFFGVNGQRRIGFEGEFSTFGTQIGLPYLGGKDRLSLFGENGRVVAALEGAGWLGTNTDPAGVVKRGADYGLLGRDGQWIVKPGPNELGPVRNGLLPIRKGGLWGIMDITGKPVVAPRWKEYKPLPAGGAVVAAGARWGLVDIQGTVVIPETWDAVERISEGWAAVRRGALWGYAEVGSGRIIEPQWSECRPFRGGLAAVKLAPEQWTFIDPTGRMAFGERSWRNVGAFSQGRWWVIEASGQEFWIDRAGRKADRVGTSAGPEAPLPDGISAESDRHPLFVDSCPTGDEPRTLFDRARQPIVRGLAAKADPLDDLIPYALPVKCGLIDASGRILKQPEWDEAAILSADMVLFRIGPKCGLADGKGATLIQPVWDDLEVLRVMTANLDEDGKTIRPGYGKGDVMWAPWVRVHDGQKEKILTLQGQPAIPDTMPDATYVDFYGPRQIAIRQPMADGTEIWSLYEPTTGKQTKFPGARTLRWNWNCAEVGVIWMQDSTSREWKLMTAGGASLDHSQPENERPDGWGFIGGLAPLHKADGWTFVRTDGRPAFADRWDDVHAFVGGFAGVCKGGKWSFIDTAGTLIAPLTWDAVADFHRGLAGVREGKQWGFIDTAGKTAVAPVWDDIHSLDRGGNHLFGFHRRSGTPGIHGTPSMDVAVVKMAAFTAIIDRSGGLIVDPQKSWVPEWGGAFLNGSESWAVVSGEGGAALVKRQWDYQRKDDYRIATPTRAWLRQPDRQGPGTAAYALIDENGKALTEAEWQPSADTRMLRPHPFARGLLTARHARSKRLGIVDPSGRVIVPPRFDAVAWIAPGVVAVWSETESGLMNDTGAWLFRDTNELVLKKSRGGEALAGGEQWEDDRQFGLALIQERPRWGYARLNRQPPSASPQ